MTVLTVTKHNRGSVTGSWVIVPGLGIPRNQRLRNPRDEAGLSSQCSNARIPELV
jgi:hypothetical protein